MEKKLKHLLEAVEKEVLRKPSRKTLDRLSLLAGFQDWNSFLKSFNGDIKEETNADVTADGEQAPTADGEENPTADTLASGEDDK